MTVNAIDIEVRKPMWVLEVFSTRRNSWEQDGGDSAYSKEEDARGHVRSIQVVATAPGVQAWAYAYEGGKFTREVSA